MNESFAYFRLPDCPDAFLVAQDGLPAVVSPDSSPSHPGFLFAPFHATEQCPTVLIRPDVFRRVSLPPPSLPPFSCSADRPAADRRADYSSSFRLFHDALARRLLSKVVLSRCETLTLSAALPPTALFSRACRAYPHLFVSLVHTPLTGTWLVATPELLLSSVADRCHTVALAGTMPSRTAGVDPVWSAKDRQEQAYVSDHVRSVIAPRSVLIDESEPHTVEAADLLHLRTDFSFRPRPGVSLAEILHALHPTPAVCGLPVAQARECILAHEPHPRRYYSGYLGPWQMAETPATTATTASTALSVPATSLFVSLRCMHIDHTSLHLYAGGGLLPQSCEQTEWDETENKLNTMKRLLHWLVKDS